jgi:hypothetical protein
MTIRAHLKRMRVSGTVYTSMALIGTLAFNLGTLMVSAHGRRSVISCRGGLSSLQRLASVKRYNPFLHLKSLIRFQSVNFTGRSLAKQQPRLAW